MNKCTNQGKVIEAKNLNKKNLVTDRDKLQRVNKDKIRKSSKKVEVHLESLKTNIL